MRILVVFFSLCCFGVFSQELKKLGSLPGFLHETSALVAVNDSVLATINDGGGKSEVYFINLKGKKVHTLNILDTKNKDWEDLALNKEGDLFIGDIGDNLNQRNHCSIYKVNKKKLFDKEVGRYRIKFSYPEKAKNPSQDSLYFDAEAMICANDSIYIFTKNRTVPFDGKVLVYSLPQKPGTYQAKLIHTFNLCQAGWQTCSITGADYDFKNDRVYLLTYKYIYRIDDFSKNKDWGLNQIRQMTIKQREGICLSKNGKKLFVSDEKHKILGGGNLYQMKLKKK